MQSHDASVAEERMNCMEVCGGHEETSKHFRRPGLDVWVRSQSRQNTTAGGGELHLISSCASGRITRVLMADVCAFGPLFQRIAVRLRDLVKRNVNSISQARAVQQMSQQLTDAAKVGGLATTLMSTYFAPTRSFALCNAGHPPPLLYRCRTRDWSFLKPDATSTSIRGSDPRCLDSHEYQKAMTKLEVGDMVLAYSNTLTECRCREGRSIGLDGLLNHVRQLDHAAPESIPEDLFKRITDQFDENLANDDATVLICHVTETPVAWRDNFLAPFRMLRSVSDRTSIQ